MLESFPIALAVGTALGFLSGLGVGGGSLLVLWLTLVLRMPQPEARILNLLFFLPSAAIACWFRWKQGLLLWKTSLPAIVSGCIAAALFTGIGSRLDLNLMKKLFGGLLLFTGIRELFWKPKNQ